MVEDQNQEKMFMIVVWSVKNWSNYPQKFNGQTYELCLLQQNTLTVLFVLVQKKKKIEI